jgi:hypothetical protein
MKIVTPESGQLPHDALTTDEVIPKGLGGRKSWENQVAACARCNGARAMIDAFVFFEKVVELGRESAVLWARHDRAARRMHWLALKRAIVHRQEKDQRRRDGPERVPIALNRRIA